MSIKTGCSVVIRAFNEEKHIERLLLGLMKQTVRDVQIILVDSGSTDQTVEIALKYPVDIVHIKPEEFTFGRSLNRGVASARNEIVVSASAHVYPVYPDWLEKLIEPFADSSVALTYGKQRGNRTTQFSEHQIFQTWFPDHSNTQQDHPFCNNANAAIRRSLWEKHAYNESLPGLEDLAWARWVYEQGYKIVYVSEAEIIHVHNETWRGVYNRYRREGMAFKQIYPQEQFSLFDFVRLYSKNVASDLQASRKKGVLKTSWKDILRFRLMQLWGTYKGYQKSGPLTWQLKQAFYYPNQFTLPMEKRTRQVAPIEYKELVEQSSRQDDTNH